MSDTNPLTAQALLALADDRIRSLCHSLLDIADRTTGDISMNARMAAVCASEYSAARAASPVTLEEHLLVAVRVAHKKFMDGIDLRGEKQGNWSSKTMSNERAFHDAEKARDEHARRLAGEGGGQ